MSEAEHASSTQIEALNEKQPEVVERKNGEEMREEAARHHATLTKDEAPHPTDIAHAVVFVLGLIKTWGV